MDVSTYLTRKSRERRGIDGLAEAVRSDCVGEKRRQELRRFARQLRGAEPLPRQAPYPAAVADALLLLERRRQARQKQRERRLEELRRQVRPARRRPGTSPGGGRRASRELTEATAASPAGLAGEFERQIAALRRGQLQHYLAQRKRRHGF